MTTRAPEAKCLLTRSMATLGCWDEVDHRTFAGQLARDEVKCHDGAPLPPELRERLLRECERLALVEQQLAALEKTRQASVPAPARQRSDALARLKGIGEVGASRLALELFWRDFSDRRQVGACVGLVPQPTTVARAIPIRGSAGRATGGYARYWSRWRGPGCATSPAVH
jgi:transposase